jgi:hypothetical protein
LAVQLNPKIIIEEGKMKIWEIMILGFMFLFIMGFLVAIFQDHLESRSRKERAKLEQYRWRL